MRVKELPAYMQLAPIIIITSSLQKLHSRFIRAIRAYLETINKVLPYRLLQSNISFFKHGTKEREECLQVIGA